MAVRISVPVLASQLRASFEMDWSEPFLEAKRLLAAYQVAMLKPDAAVGAELALELMAAAAAMNVCAHNSISEKKP